MDFKPPSIRQIIAALGCTEEVPPELRRALNPAGDFQTMPATRPGDWLAEHYEAGQTFDDFAGGAARKPDAKRNIIYLQPLGWFPEGRSPPVHMLYQYTKAAFALKVRVLEPKVIRTSEYTTRIRRDNGSRQVLTRDILWKLKRTMPQDAYCVLAVTMEDLYPQPSWNFVFGEASMDERVGVFSFGRYDPMFYNSGRKAGFRRLLLKRSCRVLLHETCHMFGLIHCIHFRCAMNGSNHLKESDARPLRLCPICLRKLQYSIGFDILERYEKLRDFFRNAGFAEEEVWVSGRMKRIREDG